MNQLANESKKLLTNLIAFSIIEKRHHFKCHIILQIWDFSTTLCFEDGKLSKLYFLTCRQMLSGDAKSSAPMIILLCNYLKINKQEQTDTESKKEKKKKTKLLPR